MLANKVADNQTMNPSLLPSIHQFYCHSVSNYMQLYLRRIEDLLAFKQTIAQPITQHQHKPQQGLKYHKLSNGQLKRRATFLNIVYQLFMVLGSVTEQISEKTYQQLLTYHNFVSLSAWLQKMRLTGDQLSKLTRLKNNIESESNIEYFHRKLISLLFQAEIFVLQILFRLMVVKMVHDQHKKLRHLRNRYQFYFHSETQNQENEMKTHERPMHISLRRKCKEAYKETNKIVTFYQLQISLSRADCRIKPEIECLIHLIQQNFSSHLVSEIFKKTHLGNISMQLKQNLKSNLFSPFILVSSNPSISIEHNSQTVNEIKGTFGQEVNNEQPFDKNVQELTIELEIKKKSEVSHIGTPQENKNMDKQYLTKQFDKTAETSKEMRLLNQENEKEKPKREKQKSVPAYLKKNGNKGAAVTKLCNYSNYKKLQFIGLNQRFGSRCNLQKRLVKSKRRHSSSQSPPQQQRRLQTFKTLQPSISQRNQANLSDMFLLADETPDQVNMNKFAKRND